MVCKNCGAPLDDGVKFCQSCGSAVNDNNVNQTNMPGVSNQEQMNNQPMYNQNQIYNQPMYNQNQMYNQPVYQPVKKNNLGLWITLGVVGAIVLIGIAFFIIIAYTAYNTTKESDKKLDDYMEQAESDKELNNYMEQEKNDNKKYGFNQKFVFDEFEITVGSNYTFTTVNNKYSEYYEKPIIKLPVTIKNLSSETRKLNMFDYKIYDAQGVEAKNVATIMNLQLEADDTLDYAGKLKTGASYVKYMYFLYNGNGTYSIEFDNYTEHYNVEFEIKK